MGRVMYSWPTYHQQQWVLVIIHLIHTVHTLRKWDTTVWCLLYVTTCSYFFLISNMWIVPLRNGIEARSSPNSLLTMSSPPPYTLILCNFPHKFSCIYAAGRLRPSMLAFYRGMDCIVYVLLSDNEGFLYYVALSFTFFFLCSIFIVYHSQQREL